MNNAIEKTISQQSLALAAFCAVYTNKKNLAMDARNEFNLQDRLGYLVKLAFPKFANVEPGDLDSDSLSKEYVRTALEPLSRGVASLQYVNEAAQACLVLILASSDDMASHAVDAANGGLSENVFVAFPELATERTRRSAAWEDIADLKFEGFSTQAQALSTWGKLYPYEIDELNVRKLQETAAREIAAAHGFELGI